MCGIAGAYVSLNNSSAVVDAEALVNSIVKSQYNRGPDNQALNTHIGKKVKAVFGHDRLSIIDLHVSANQPMWDESKRYCLVFNGEIYNYLELRQELIAQGRSFKTSSDAEVLLQAFMVWGEDAVNRFNGMFAFAIFDAVTEDLWLFRDRFGVKPVYYYLDKNALYFASTGKVIASSMGLKPNLSYVARGLYFGFYEDASSISQYEKLEALPSGHYLKASINSSGKLITQVVKYYDLAERAAAKVDILASKNFVTLLDELSAVFTQAIKFRLRSDVPVGVSLSGGLDSATVAAFAARQHRNIIGFTLGDPNDSRTEGPLVAQLTKKIGIDVNYITPDPKDMADAFMRTLQAQDAPFTTLSIVAQNLVYKMAHEKGIKVLLGGQGGDESFLGYRKFIMFHLLELIRDKKLTQFIWLLFTMTPTLIREITNVNLYWNVRKRYFSSRGDVGTLCLPQIDALNFGVTRGISLQQRQIQDVLQFSLPTLLRYEDRNSMDWSIESRLPFLDYNLVEFAVALPVACKITNGYGKWIVRKMAADILPKAICFARNKRGFDINSMLWIKKGLGKFIRERLKQNETIITKFLPKNCHIDQLYTDENLAIKHQSMHEAITLMWLVNKY